jgi:integrase
MSDVYRRCGCRDASGKNYGPLPDRATEKQRAAACPILLRDPKHGSWGFALSGGTHAGTGKRVQVRKMGFNTKKEAQQERAKVLDEISSGRFRRDQKMLMSQYMPGWLDRRIKDGLRPSTTKMYKTYLAVDIVPALGAVRLSELRKYHVDAFLRSLSDAGRGPTTVRRIHAVLRSALGSAERLDLVTYNAAAKVDLPSVHRTRTQIWEPDQVRQFLDSVAHVRHGVIFELAVFTGLRRGELAGLRWENIDFTKRELIVRQQRVQMGGQILEGVIKTASGQDRKVSLGSEAIGALVAWKLRQDTERERWGDAYTDEGWVFTYENGKPLQPEYLSKTFQRFVEASGLPRIRFHDLRHEHASLLLSGGVEMAVVSKRLGHSTISITSDLYSHLLEDANRAAADAAEQMLPAKNRSAHTLLTQSPENEIKGPGLSSETLDSIDVWQVRDSNPRS